MRSVRDGCGTSVSNIKPGAGGETGSRITMSPTAEIAQSMAHDQHIRKMRRDTYASLLRNEEEAQKRAKKYKEQRRGNL